jgi:hypothetical protein
VHTRRRLQESGGRRRQNGSRSSGFSVIMEATATAAATVAAEGPGEAAGGWAQRFENSMSIRRAW